METKVQEMLTTRSIKISSEVEALATFGGMVCAWHQGIFTQATRTSPHLVRPLHQLDQETNFSDNPVMDSCQAQDQSIQGQQEPLSRLLPWHLYQRMTQYCPTRQFPLHCTEQRKK